MKMPDYRVIALAAFLGSIMLTGCDPRSEEPASENQPVTRSLRESRSAPVSSRASQDDSLYRQILETMQQENRALKLQILATVEKCTQLETQLNEIKLERDVAFKAYIKVSESIESLKTDAGSKDRRINELEQANEIQEQTIAQLTQQLSQVLLELNNSSSDIINDNIVIDRDG
jgi:chromosome segregation ATPase